MYDAARAALLAAGAPVEAEIVRTYSGLISSFSLHLVKPGRVPLELARALNRVEEIRSSPCNALLARGEVTLSASASLTP
ncbi:MAG: hypothetical protein ACREVG_13810 [Burkholderiales bacterium]